jgi:hypothetical protein
VKRVPSFVAGLIVGAVLLGVLGLFVGYELVQRGTPALVLRNVTEAPVTHLILHSDHGDSRSLGRLAPQASRRVHLAGADQLIWLTGSTSAGRSLESQHVYVTSGVLVVGTISADKIALEPTL